VIGCEARQAFSATKNTGGLSSKLPSLTFINSIHTTIFEVQTGFLVIFFYKVISDRITAFSRIALTLFLTEGIGLLYNGWRCPLTVLAESINSMQGQGADSILSE
jgi:hypothetical protein